MPYDLYGNYYVSSIDASNAEYAQMAEIDARAADRRSREVQRDMHRNEQMYSQYIEEHHWRLKYVEEPYLHYRDEQEKHNNYG